LAALALGRVWRVRQPTLFFLRVALQQLADHRLALRLALDRGENLSATPRVMALDGLERRQRRLIARGLFQSLDQRLTVLRRRQPPLGLGDS
jgi:hypothetical protein